MRGPIGNGPAHGRRWRHRCYEAGRLADYLEGRISAGAQAGINDSSPVKAGAQEENENG